MSRIGAKSYDLERGGHWRHGARFVSLKPAARKSVEAVLAADEDDENGRSEWLWVRLPNGDLILGVYPQGDTYLATERDHSF